MKFSTRFPTILSLLFITHQRAFASAHDGKKEIKAGRGVYSFAFAPSLDDRLKELHRRTQEVQGSDVAVEEINEPSAVCDEGFDDDAALAANSMAAQYGLTTCADTYKIMMDNLDSSDLLCKGIGAGLCNCTCAGVEVQASTKVAGIPFDESPSIDADGAEDDLQKPFSCEEFAMMDTSSLELLPDYLMGNLVEWKCTELGKVGILLWKADETTITFAVEFLSSGGGAGIGVSANGGMKGADFFMVSKVNEEWSLQDMFSTGYAYDGSLVTLDQSQDGRLEWADEDDNGERLAFAVTRPIVSCDAEEDLEILGGSVPVIWARFGIHGVSYHGPGKDSRGTVYLDLLSENSEKTQDSIALPEDTNDLFTLDLRMSGEGQNRYQLPDGKVNTYACRSFELPTDQPYHIVSYEAILDTVNTDANVVHHVVIYSCDGDPFFNEPAECGEGMAATCQQVEISWAVGMPTQYLPPKAGLPLAHYVLLEMHYENLAGEDGVMDGSGIRLTYTPELREQDFGYLFIGTSLQHTPDLEPGQTSLTRRGYCPAECLKRHLPESGVQTHGQFFHTHLQGRSLYTHHYRQEDVQQADVQGAEIMPPLFGDMPYYDFNHQAFKFYGDEPMLHPGDALVTTCFYNTRDKQDNTGFGLETQDEMCFVVVGVYPAIDLKYCWNSTDTGAMCTTTEDGSWDFVESPLPAGADSFFSSPSAFDFSSSTNDRCVDIHAISSDTGKTGKTTGAVVGVIVCVLLLVVVALLYSRKGQEGAHSGSGLQKNATAHDDSALTSQNGSSLDDLENKEPPRMEQALAEAY